MHYRIKGVDSKKCDGCEKCVKVCPKGCFEMVDENNKIIAKFTNSDKCNSCGDCIIVCPTEGSAIILEPLIKGKDGYVKEINKKKCLACEKCIKLCPGKNIEITEENGKVFAKIIDPKKCIADGHCSFSCPVDDKVYSKEKC